jgi:hypothetical protein
MDPGPTADWEYAGMVPTIAETMLMRLSVTTQLHDDMAFIGPLQGSEARSHAARVLRNHLSVFSDLMLVSSRVDLIHLVNVISSSKHMPHSSYS